VLLLAGGDGDVARNPDRHVCAGRFAVHARAALAIGRSASFFEATRPSPTKAATSPISPTTFKVGSVSAAAPSSSDPPHRFAASRAAASRMAQRSCRFGDQRAELRGLVEREFGGNAHQLLSGGIGSFVSPPLTFVFS